MYVREALSTIDPGQTYQKQSKVEVASIAANGDVLQAKTYGYGSLTTPQKTVNCSYC